MTAAPPPAAKAAHQRAPSLEDAPKPLPPLLKWAGGKRWLTGHILKRLPRTYGTYLEPFAGGAALFFAIQPKKAILGDINGDLMEFYRQVRDEPEAVITAALQWPNTKETYLKVRALTPHNPAERAARLLYLTSLSFNGIYRVNLKGTFNVPYGHKCHVQPCDPARIRAASAALKCAQLETRDFFETAGMAQAGDLVYFDPPYTARHNNNGFVKYNASMFDWPGQERLAKLASTLVDRGCHVLVSNASFEDITRLYPRFQHELLPRHSVIGARTEWRCKVNESLFYGGFGTPQEEG